MTSRKLIVVAAGAAILAAGATLAIRSVGPHVEQAVGKKAAPRFDLAVKVEPVSRASVSQRVKATGRVRPVVSVPATSSVSGKAIDRVYSKQGDLLAAGAPIASVDSRALDAAVEQAEASLQSAEVASKQADAALVRTARLADAGTATRQALEDAQASAATAASSVRQAKAALEIAKIDQKAALIVAPVAGVVLGDPLPEGTILSSGTPVVEIAKDGRMELAAALPEQQLRLVSTGQEAVVEGLDGRKVRGEVRLVDVSVGDASRLGTVRIDLPPDTGMTPGMFASAVIECGQRTVLTVPASAVSYRNGRPVVFVVRDGVAFLRPIGVGSRDGGRAEVTEGLSEGEEVVAQGGGLLNDGNAVKVVSPAEAGR